MTRAPARAGGQRRRKPGRAAADDQHIAEGVGLLIMVGIGLAGRAAEPAARRISGS